MDCCVHVPKCLRGIVNGIDYDDIQSGYRYVSLSSKYNAITFRKEKIEEQGRSCRRILDWIEDPKTKCMIGIVSRLTDQKGFDLDGVYYG